MNDPSELERKLAYYRKRLDDSAGKLVQADYRLSQLKHALEQRRRGFALLAEFQQTVGALGSREEVVRAVAGALVGSLGMTRSVVYERRDGAFAPTVTLGFDEGDHASPLPDAVATLDRPLLVTRATPADAPGAPLLEALGMKSLACAPLRDDGLTFAWLVTGRTKEMLPLHPPLDAVDLETLVVIAASLAAVLQSRRVTVLRELDQLRMDFFANISHEFRTPITLTLAPLDALVAGRAGALPEAAAEHLRLAQRNQRKLLDLVNQILDLSKIESGKGALRRMNHGDAPSLVRAIAQGFAELARARRVSLRADGDAQPDGLVVPLDVEMFDRALTNVLANAIKFTPDGEVAVAWRFGPEGFVVEVRDTGIGIDEADLPYVFDRFRRSAAAARHAGTGIGLSLVKEIVELHGGAVRVRSRRGAGTAFELCFPTAEGDAETRMTAPALPPAAHGLDALDDDDVPAWNLRAERATTGARPTILYVDDNRDLRRHVGALLSDEHAVFLARDGEEALAMLRARTFDLVLSDVMMPRVDGVELCRRVRADPALRHLPLVLLTAKSGEADRLAALDLGVDDYLGKPFTHAELLARVRNLLRMRAAQLQTERDVRVARSIQHAVLPPPTTRVAGCEVEHLYEPCDALSGDFCDAFESGDAGVLYVADVTGHGIASAQVTYLVRESFRRRALPGRGLRELVGAVADDLRGFGLDFDVSAHVGLVRDGALSLCRAGAPHAVRVRDGAAEVIASPPSSTLGPLVESAAPLVELPLREGDQVFLFSDGATELTGGGRAVGMRRLRDLLARAAARADWREELRSLFAASRAAGELRDDITVLRLRA